MQDICAEAVPQALRAIRSRQRKAKDVIEHEQLWILRHMLENGVSGKLIERQLKVMEAGQ